MSPYDNQPPQVAALANRFNPQLLAPQGDSLQRQGPPVTSGQIQPTGLQPQSSPAYNGLMQRFNLRPQVQALAQQYNPQFTPQMLGGNPNAAPMQNQFQLAQQMQNNAVQFAQPPSWNNPQGMAQPTPQQLQQFNNQIQMAEAQASLANNMGNMQPAANPSFTPAGQAQNNFLTTPTPQYMPNVAVPQGGFQPATLTQGVQTHPMAGTGRGIGMAQPYGGGVHGLARFYAR